MKIRVVFLTGLIFLTFSLGCQNNLPRQICCLESVQTDSTKYEHVRLSKKVNPDMILNYDEFLLVKSLIEKSMITYSKKGNNTEINLDDYKKVFLTPGLSKSGDKEVTVLCSCRELDYLEALLALDGGECYFTVRINLVKKTYSNMRIGDLA